ncbi:hypothetical protein Pfo_005965 [Paulownia fortunei]|nr:hypothetical protein Pfo_005965 [Paulownia fortunei]
MKIFNWVHRRFNNKAGSAENSKKNGLIADDKQFLVENNTNVLELWRGGILTIGTFGYDPLKDENEQNDVHFYEEEYSEKEQLSVEYESDQITDSEEEVENEEEVNPLVFASYAHDFEGLMGMKMERSNNREEFEFEYVMMEKRKKERITLADLFSADSEELQKKQPINKGEIIKEKAAKCSSSKHGVSFGKKLVVEDARPIHKLHQLLRRMLKRKIHPDLAPLNSVNTCETNDYASLLPTQDAVL